MNDHNPTSAQADETAAPEIVKITATAMFALNVGWAIDLNAARSDFLAGVSPLDPPQASASERGWIKFSVPPLSKRITVGEDQLQFNGFKIDQAAVVTVFDSGAIAVRFTLDLTGRSFEQLVEISSKLYTSSELQQLARKIAEETRAAILVHIERPEMELNLEDYFVFDIEQTEGSDGKELLQRHQLQAAQILLGDTDRLSKGRIEKTLDMHTDYHEGDYAVLGWRGALCIGKHWDDVVAIMEHANVELLELREVKATVERELHVTRENLRNRRFWHINRWLHWASLVKVQELISEVREQIRRIDNPLNLTGDTFLAEVYGILKDRMAITDEEVEVKELLEELNGLESSIAERAAAMRTDLIAFGTFALGLVVGEMEFFQTGWAWFTENAAYLRQRFTL